MRHLFLTASTITSALGRGTNEHVQALREQRSGLTPCRYPGSESLSTFVGEVKGVDDTQLPEELVAYNCRNNRLAELGLGQDGFCAAVKDAINRYGAERVAVFIGTSTSGIGETERAYAHFLTDGVFPAYNYASTHNNYSITDYLRQRLGLRGPAHAVSTACSSSSKVFASAWRAMATGLCDAAVVGGVDSLCLTTLYGFNSLELVSRQPCKPFDVNRDGISIGEAAGFALLEWQAQNGTNVALLGYGESSDAHHISAPHPEGVGARAAMEQALQQGGRTANDIGYVHLHGTGTPANDKAESHAVHAVFGEQVMASSSKGWTGHTLGAAGITGTLFAEICLKESMLLANLNLQEADVSLPINVQAVNGELKFPTVMTNSFGFGGSNCSLLLGYS